MCIVHSWCIDVFTCKVYCQVLRKKNKVWISLPLSELLHSHSAPDNNPLWNLYSECLMWSQVAALLCCFWYHLKSKEICVLTCFAGIVTFLPIARTLFVFVFLLFCKVFVFFKSCLRHWVERHLKKKQCLWLSLELFCTSTDEICKKYINRKPVSVCLGATRCQVRHLFFIYLFLLGD